jgi:hypothetical protein
MGDAVRDAMRAELVEHDQTVTRAVADAEAHLEQLVADREGHLVTVLDHLADSIDAMVDLLDVQTRELHGHMAKTELLTRELLLASLPSDAAPSTVRGGSIEAARARWVAAPSIERAIDLREDLAPGARVEVRSHFQGRWIGGFRLLEIVETPDGLRYRVERRVDHSALPVLFGPNEIRAATNPLEAVATVETLDAIEHDDVPSDPGATRL